MLVHPTTTLEASSPRCWTPQQLKMNNRAGGMNLDVQNLPPTRLVPPGWASSLQRAQRRRASIGAILLDPSSESCQNRAPRRNSTSDGSPVKPIRSPEASHDRWSPTPSSSKHFSEVLVDSVSLKAKCTDWPSEHTNPLVDQDAQEYYGYEPQTPPTRNTAQQIESSAEKRSTKSPRPTPRTYRRWSLEANQPSARSRNNEDLHWSDHPVRRMSVTSSASGRSSTVSILTERSDPTKHNLLSPQSAHSCRWDSAAPSKSLLSDEGIRVTTVTKDYGYGDESCDQVAGGVARRRSSITSTTITSGSTTVSIDQSDHESTVPAVMIEDYGVNNSHAEGKISLKRRPDGSPQGRQPRRWSISVAVPGALPIQIEIQEDEAALDDDLHRGDAAPSPPRRSLVMATEAGRPDVVADHTQFSFAQECPRRRSVVLGTVPSSNANVASAPARRRNSLSYSGQLDMLPRAGFWEADLRPTVVPSLSPLM